jgi:ubiquinone/menaquinone biosynthesis C-methylase UbiE
MEAGMTSLLRKKPIRYQGLCFFDLPSSKYPELRAGMADENRWHFTNSSAQDHLNFLRQWAPDVVKWTATLPFSPGSIHLDLGAGEGSLCYILGRCGYHSIAVELSATILHSATLYQAHFDKNASNHASLDLWVADIYDLPLADESVDFITIKDLLHHLVDLDGLFQEVARVLKPQGMIYVWEPFYPSLAPFQWLVFKFIKPKELSLGVRHVYHSYKAYEQLLGRWLTEITMRRSYVRSKLQHYLTRNRFFIGSMYAEGSIESSRREKKSALKDRVQIEPLDFLSTDMISTGLHTTRLRKNLLDHLLSVGR